MKLKKTFALLSVLTILCSVFGALLLPATPAAALDSGWVNRRTINYTANASVPSAAQNSLFTDSNTYDQNYTFTSEASNPNGCTDRDLITFKFIRSTSNQGFESNGTLRNTAFYYHDVSYNSMQIFYRTYAKQSGSDLCSFTETRVGSLANAGNRKIVFVQSTDGATISNIMNGITFGKAANNFYDNYLMYEERGTNDVCKDVIVLHPANSYRSGPVYFGNDAVGGSSTLYAARDTASDDSRQFSESYVSEFLGLIPAGSSRGTQNTEIMCHIAVRDGVRIDITNSGGYGLIDSAETAEDFISNGLKKGGGWFESGSERDDAFVIFVGKEADNQVPGDSSVPIPPGENAQAGNTVCDQNPGGNGLGWLFCSFSDAILQGLNSLDSKILNQLKINTDDIFGGGANGTAFRKAWSVFRTIAYSLLVILGLVMIVSQVMGLDLFDAYTIRKMLPKLVAVAVIIPLLWPILKVLFEMSNDSADAIQGLLYAPFKGTATDAITCAAGSWSFDCIPDAISISAIITAGVAGVAGVGAFIAFGGFGVLLAMLVSGFLAVVSALFILLARDIVAYALIIASPIAVVCSIFEPFKKVFTLFRTFLATILLAVPAVAAVLAASHVAAKIALIANQGNVWGVLMAIVFIIMGLFLFWKTFQTLDKVSSQFGNVVGNVTGKAQKALGEYRSNSRKHRLEEAVEGRRNFHGPLGTGWLANRAAGVVRRGKLAGEVGAGAFGLGGRAGRARYNEGVRTMQSAAANKMMEHDKDRAGGDDDAMRLLARRGMDGRRFIREYAAIQRRSGASEQEAMQRARNALGLSETSLGAHAGTSAMRIAAQRSLLKSNTSYRRSWMQDENGQWQNREMDFRTMNRQMYGDVAELVNDGLITVSDGTQMIKSNGARADRAGLGWGSSMGVLSDVAQHGVDVLDVEDANGEARHVAMADEVLVGTPPGQMVGQRHEAVRILAPEMLRRARLAHERDQGNLNREFIEHIAAGASRQDLAGQLPELNAALQANNFLGQDIGGGTMGQWIEVLRNGIQPNHPLYQELYQAQLRRVQQQFPASPPAQQAATAQAALNDNMREAMRVFQEYRREYGSAWQAQGQPAPGQQPGAIPPAGGNPFGG